MPYSHYYEKSGLFHGSMANIMRTRLDVVMMGEKHGLSAVWAQVVAEAERLYGMLNRFDPESSIARINRCAAARPVELNDELWAILTDLQKYYRDTFGYFDATLRDFSRVILDENLRTVAFAEENISLDLGGYAKGYTLEKIRKVLLQAGVGQALVNFGDSSVLALGAHPHGKYWEVGVENPLQPGQQVKSYPLYNQSLSVSGNTTQHTEHIVNPLTGKYTTERKIVSVVSSNAVEAEALSTALMVADEISISDIKKVHGNVKIDIFVLSSPCAYTGR